MENPPVPARAPEPFTNGIRHPECYLWDAWSCRLGDTIYLFTLAVNRRDANGELVSPSCRASSRFHIRQFASSDGGSSWKDLGAFQQAGTSGDGHDTRNIWSGSVLSRNVGDDVWAAYTSIHEVDAAHPFVQCLAVGRGTAGGAFEVGSGNVLLCPITDGERIEAAGYFIDRTAGLGGVSGEAGGPIMAWRDPFLFRTFDGELLMAWAAKRKNGEPAMGLAILKEENEQLAVETLLPPVALPDAEEFTQFEIPKIYLDRVNSRYVLITATTDRRSEAQEGSEIAAVIRVYHAPSASGPWLPGGTESSVLAGADNYFGMTVLQTCDDREQFISIAPLTDQAAIDNVLTVSPRFSLDINSIGRVNRLSVGSTHE